MKTGLVFLFGLVLSFSAGASTLVENHLQEGLKIIPYPSQSFIKVAQKIDVKFHQDKEVAMASFAPGKGLISPKLFMYEPYYKQASGALVPMIQMVIDVSDYYFTSLAEGYLTLFVEGSGSSYESYYLSRADKVFASVPQANRVEAYRNALASFIGSQMSIVIAAQRSFLKNGKNICPAFDRPQSLFTLWEANFDDRAAFVGFYADKNGNWVETKIPVPRADKVELIKQGFENLWTGDRVLDFKNRFCN